jgi:hypothetical protein
MAVANTKSTAVTAADASPPTLVNSYISAGLLRESVGTVEAAAADDNDSIYRMVRVPSSARITNVFVASDAVTGSSDVNVGVWQTAANGGAVVSENLFGDAVDLSSAVAFTDVILETTATDIVNVEKRLWEMLSLTVDPMRDYDICLKAVAAASAAGTYSMKVRFVI